MKEEIAFPRGLIGSLKITAGKVNTCNAMGTEGAYGCIYTLVHILFGRTRTS